MSKKAFTLVEILIVVMILGILAAVVMPRFSTATTEARESMVRKDLHMIRTQIGIYAAQHRETSPGYDPATGAASADAFIAHMTQYSDIDGNTNATETAVFKYGPYLSKIPANPLNNLSTITIVDDDVDLPAEATNAVGWVYKPETVEILCDSPGSTGSGQTYLSF